MKTAVCHNLKSRVSVGVSFGEDDTALIALSVCHPKDEPVRKLANMVLFGRLRAGEKSSMTTKVKCPASKEERSKLIKKVFGLIRSQNGRPQVNKLLKKLNSI